ncbi:MAG: T9SS type A sorting domain-containing protein [Chitinophagales bacterium]|nr:T9SS type A sorting domain-containing protein [Bacteroidota bacterium]
MHKINTYFLYLFFFLFAYNFATAQCPLSGVSQYIAFEQTDALLPDCTNRWQTPSNIVSGVGYTAMLEANQTYVVGNCSAAGSWNLTISVYDPSGNLLAYDDGTTSGCGNGALITFQTTDAGSYTFITAMPNCQSNTNGSNGRIYLYNNTTDPSAECPITTAQCIANITTDLASAALQGSGTETDPFVFCAEDGLYLTSEIIDPSTYFTPDENMPAGAVVFTMYLDQPITDNPFANYDPSFTQIALGNANGDLIFDEGLVNLTGLVGAGIFAYNTPYVIVPMLVPVEGSTQTQLEPVCLGDIQTDGSYPYVSFAEPIAPGEGCVVCETAGGNISLDNGDTTLSICAGNEVPNIISLNVSENAGMNYAYFITNEQDSIISEILTSPIELAADIPAGTCRIYGVAYDGNLVLGDFATELFGNCPSLSQNFVEVTKINVEGGNIALENGDIALATCANDENTFVSVLAENNTGTNYGFFATDSEGNIVTSLNNDGIFNFNGFATGMYQIYGIAYENAVSVNENETLNDISGFCFSLSANSIEIANTQVVAGNVQLADGSESISFCIDDGIADTLNVQVNGTSDAENVVYFMADAQGNVIGEISTSGTFDLDGSTAGVYQVYALAYNGTFTSAENITDFAADCFALSNNTIEVILNAGEDCPNDCNNSDLAIIVTEAPDCNYGGMISFYATGGIGEVNLTYNFNYQNLVSENEGVFTAILTHNETYTITATDSLGCEVVYSGQNTCPDPCENSDPDFFVDVVCNTNANGFLNGYGTIFINVPQDMGVIFLAGSNLTGDVLPHESTYSVSVLLEFGCGGTISGVIDCPEDVNDPCLTTDLSIIPSISCNNNGTAIFAYEVSGGAPPYDLAGTDNSVLLVNGDYYAVTVTDSLGCMTILEGVIDCPNICENSDLSIVTDNICNPDGSLTLQYTIGGGVEPYEVMGLASGTIIEAGNTYTIIVTDAEACNATLTGNTELCPNLCENLEIIPDFSCDNNGNITFTYEVIGATGDYQSSGTANGALLSNGSNYSVEITDENNCFASISGTIAQDACADCSLFQISAAYECIDDTQYTLSFSFSGGVSPYNYTVEAEGETLVSYSEETNEAEASIILPNNTSFTISVTDGNGCTANYNSGEVVECVTIQPLSATAIAICNDDNSAFILEINIEGGAAPYALDGTFVINDIYDNLVTTDALVAGSSYTLSIEDTSGQSFLLEGGPVSCKPANCSTLVVSQVEECNTDVGEYVVHVSIDGGNPPYLVEGTIEDVVMGDFTMGPFVGGSSYTLYITDDEGCTYSYISEAIPCKPTTLQVDLLKFTGQMQQQDNILLWETASEQNTAFFEVERSKNAYAFETVGRINAAGNSNSNKKYQLKDKNVPNGLLYYRLRTTDQDGNFQLSNTISLARNPSFELVSISPVPACDVLNVQVFITDSDTPIFVYVYDLTGKEVSSHVYENKIGQVDLDVPVEQLSQGMYFLNISYGDIVQTRKFVKE